MRTLDDGSTFAQAILQTVELPLLALDRDLRVESANDAFLRCFDVEFRETVGRLVYDIGNRQWDIPELRRLLVDILPNDGVVKNYRVEHVFEGIGRRVMRLDARRIHRIGTSDSILIAIHDDTERERLRQEVAGRVEFAEKLIDSIREGLLVLDGSLRVHSANQTFYDLFQVDRAETEGSLVYDLGNGQWDIPELRQLLEDILPKAKSFDDYEVRHTFDTIGERVMLLNARRLDHLDLVLLGMRDVTAQLREEQERCKREAALRDGERRYRQLFNSIDQGFCVIELIFDGSERAVDFRFVEVNAAFEAQSGLADVTGKTMKSLEPKHDDFWFDLFGCISATGIPQRYQHFSENLGRHFEGFAFPFGDPCERKLGILFCDATERRRADAALRQSEEMKAFFLRLSDALRPLAAPVDIEGEACRLLAEQIDVERAYFVEIDEAANSAVVARDFTRGAAPSLAGRHRLSEFGWSAEILRRGECVAVADVQTSEIIPPHDRQACVALQVNAFLAAPLRKAGRLIGALCAADNRPREWSETEVEIVQAVGERIWGAVVRARAEAAVAASQQLLCQAMAAAEAGSWTVNTETWDFAASDRALELHGLPAGCPINHEQAMSGVHPDDRERIDAALQHSFDTGEPYKVEYRAPQPDGSTRWLASFAEHHVEAGVPILVGLVQDISERKRHEEQVQLLMREVNHRSKNMLSLIQAIAHQTARTHAEDFIAHFDKRVQSLAAAQDLLVRSDWKEVPFADLILSQLGHFADLIGRRVRVDGPALLTMPAAAQSIGMAVHELATNAAKYGALSNDTGRIDVTWRCEAGQSAAATFILEWIESGGPPVEKPQRRGFGSSVTTAMVEMNVGGDVELDYAPTGLRWRFRCEAENIIDGGCRRSHKADGVSALSGRPRVLVVEDEAIFATDMALTLEDAGFDVIGPAASVEQALSLLAQTTCDAAVLDVNLRNATSEPVAERLAELGAPYIAVTGYSRAQLPETFEGVPLLTKPLQKAVLVAVLKRLVDDHAPV